MRYKLASQCPTADLVSASARISVISVEFGQAASPCSAIACNIAARNHLQQLAPAARPPQKLFCQPISPRYTSAADSTAASVNKTAPQPSVVAPNFKAVLARACASVLLAVMVMSNCEQTNCVRHRLFWDCGRHVMFVARMHQVAAYRHCRFDSDIFRVLSELCR